MTKTEELEKAVLLLEEQVETNKSLGMNYLEDLTKAKKDLADVNKPELTPLQFDNLYEAIESGISNYDFSDSDNFDKEFGIDYDGRVTLESFDINNSQELVEAICDKVNKLFTEKLHTNEANQAMRRVIYDMYYADEISVEITERLLDALEKSRNKRRY